MSSTSEIEQQVAEWAVRMSTAPLTADEQRALKSWLEADLRHVGALAKARAQWQQLDRVAMLHQGNGATFPSAGITPPFSGWSRRALLAASLSGIGVLGLGWSNWSPAQELYTTEIGEMRRIPLADGSTLILNTDSAARVQVADDQRRVHLLRGEALFEVQADPRPFVVTAREWQMLAQSTVFGVRLRPQQVTVTVKQGEIALQTDTTYTSSAPTRIDANKQLQLNTAHPMQVEAISEQLLEQRFAWLDGMVVFSGETLREAVAEINRHNHRQLVIDDASLAAQPIVGAFKATDVDAFAAAAAAALSAEQAARGDAIHLRLPHRA